jgi:hypothetical protein
MKVELSGMRNGVEWPPRGSVIELPDDEAAEYCAAGMAEPVAVFDGDEEKAVMPDDAEERGPLTTKRGPRKTAAKAATTEGKGAASGPGS